MPLQQVRVWLVPLWEERRPLLAPQVVVTGNLALMARSTLFEGSVKHANQSGALYFDAHTSIQVASALLFVSAAVDRSIASYILTFAMPLTLCGSFFPLADQKLLTFNAY
jgi:hypothetical protein